MNYVAETHWAPLAADLSLPLIVSVAGTQSRTSISSGSSKVLGRKARTENIYKTYLIKDQYSKYIKNFRGPVRK